MTTTLENGGLRIALSGHIDSSNAPEVEAQIMEAREREAHESLTLDLKELKYISSAGLRIVLRLRKLEPSLRLVEASSEVYEVLEMTGFTEMMPVEKAFRELSVEGCEVIGRGANGIVYRIDKDTVVKAYHKRDCLPDVRRERELARKAFVLGVPTAIPYDVVRVGDSYGSVFELLNSRSFSKLIADEPERMDEWAALFVEPMRRLHATKVAPGELPDVKDFMLDCAEYARKRLPDGLGEKLREMVQAVPDTNTMIHGDFHTNNIVMQNDEVLIIDMDTLSVGHPVFELGSVYMAFVGFGEMDPSAPEKFMKLSYDLTTRFWDKVLRCYLNTQDEARAKEVEEKAQIICYARMLRRTLRRDGLNNEEGRKVIAMCEGHLRELLARVDSLCF